MRYWDSSALLPLFVPEPSTVRAEGWISEDQDIVTWWGSPLECWGAFCRLEREGMLGGAEFRVAAERFRASCATWHLVGADAGIRTHAERLLRIHPLKTADALQLAACHRARELEEGIEAFVTLDAKLAAIAEREGFEIVM